ncbi:MAG: ABC transporter ATP-binding protein [Sediminibacterium sp.]|nr:ABC transporter ATP-binding protein [Sediminibacterium sp.]
MIHINPFHIYQAVSGLPEFSTVSEVLGKQMSKAKPGSYSDIFRLVAGLNKEQIGYAIRFEESHVSALQLREFIESSSLPIIIFKGDSGKIQPYLLLHQGDQIKETDLATGITTLHKWEGYNYGTLYMPELGGNCITLAPFETVYTRLIRENPNASPFKKLLAILRMDSKDILSLFFYATLGGLIGLAIPLGIQSLINFLQTGQVTASGIVLIIVIILSVLFSGLLQIVQLWLMEILQQRLFAKIALDFTYRLPKLSFEKNRHLFGPEVMNRFFDIVSLQKGLSSVLIDLTSSLLQIVFGLLILSFYHPVFIAFSAFLIIVIYLIIRFTSGKGMEYSLKESKFKYSAVSWLQTVARSRFSFQMSEINNLHSRRMDTLVGDYIVARKKHFRVLITQYLAFVVFSVLITGGLLVIGYYLLLSESITLGQFVAAEIIILLIVNSVEKSILKIESVYDILTSVEKISQVVALPLEQGEQGMTFTETEHLTLRFDNLKAGNTYVTFSAELGSHYHVGFNSQAEKDELTEVLAKTKTPEHGNLYVNGIQYSLIDKSFLIRKIAFSTAQESLFDGTILENITMGQKTIDEHQVRAILSELNALSFINNYPEGLYTEIIGGHYADHHELYQYCLLARMILKKTQIMVYDTALLPRTISPSQIETYLKMKNRNAIIIALNLKDNEY